jgi:hypothetical protein
MTVTPVRLESVKFRLIGWCQFFDKDPNEEIKPRVMEMLEEIDLNPPPTKDKVE